MKLATGSPPRQHPDSWLLADGTPVHIRAMCPADEPMMVEFHRHLSERSVYHRWFNAFGLDQRIAHERLSRICHIDGDHEMALVVEHTNASRRREIIAVGRLSRLEGQNAAEFALVICDAWQRHGLGTELLRRLVRIGREQGLDRITAHILPENHAMRAVARKAGFTLHSDLSGGECRAEMLL